MGNELSRHTKYRRTKKGFIVVLYGNQKRNSKRRNHPLPAYTFNELYEWLVNKKLFHQLFSQWVCSGYDKWYMPSIDRIDDYKGYSFDNIKLVTWYDNYNRACYDRKNGINNKGCKAVLKCDMDGNVIKEYHSTQFAFRDTGISQGNLSAVCRGLRNHAGGFKWKYK